MTSAEPTHVLYKSTDCVRCPLAAGSMDRAGIKYEVVFLDHAENAHILEALRAEMNREFIPLPTVRTPDGRLLDNLATISAEFRR